jgi:hypothetical protein
MHVSASGLSCSQQSAPILDFYWLLHKNNHPTIIIIIIIIFFFLSTDRPSNQCRCRCCCTASHIGIDCGTHRS